MNSRAKGEEEKITVKPPPSLSENPTMSKEKAYGQRKPKEGTEKIELDPPTSLAENPVAPREEVRSK